MTRYFGFAVLLLLLVSGAGAENLLRDAAFRGGYQIISPEKNPYTGRERVEMLHGTEPIWRLVQWGGGPSLAEVSPLEKAGGDREWTLSVSRGGEQQILKRVQISADGELLLELNALTYFSSLRYADLVGEDLYLDSLQQYWPHLLMVQSLDGKKLNEYKTLRLSLDTKLMFDQLNIREGYQPGLHAARFPLILGVRDTLSRNLFWLSLVLYDDRYESTPFNCRKCTTGPDGQQRCRIPLSLAEPGGWDCPRDGLHRTQGGQKPGTGKMIFRIPSTAATLEKGVPDEWRHYSLDLMPYLRAAVEAARESPDQKGFSPDLRFYQLSVISLGWEITGLNHAAMMVKNLSLVGE